jgi:hypothetical protein
MVEERLDRETICSPLGAAAANRRAQDSHGINPVRIRSQGDPKERPAARTPSTPMIVVDTSVWVSARRHPSGEVFQTLQGLLDADEVVLRFLCGSSSGRAPQKAIGGPFSGRSAHFLSLSQRKRRGNPSMNGSPERLMQAISNEWPN